MSEIPNELRYTKAHECIRIEGDEVIVGITDYAQNALTDVVWVEIDPDLEGTDVAEMESFCSVESVKSVSEIYLPQYEELATLVDEENTQAHFIAKFMGDHERAILQASENILKGTNNPIEPITKLLKFPI